ncbi:DUF3180 domain-containing protein [Quadrisphaera sp. KR29]|uniref:DUF3180 domain-containing protein n=1 Tax=Quadrisphaera sp. KR29 TaxID=3461391 RepID=UPI004044516A
MSPLRTRVLLSVAVVAGVLTWVVLDVVDGTGASVPLPWTVPVLLVVLALAVLSVGRPVRRWNLGHRDRPLDALRAARTVVVAQAAGVTGAALAGAYGGFVALLLPMLDIEVRRDRVLLALAALAASLLLLVAGVVVERWCRLPPDDDAPGGAGPGRGGTPGRRGAPGGTGRSSGPRRGQTGRAPSSEARDGDVRRSAE